MWPGGIPSRFTHSLTVPRSLMVCGEPYGMRPSVPMLLLEQQIVASLLGSQQPWRAPCRPLTTDRSRQMSSLLNIAKG
jgi:hypothetical protein